MSKNHCDELYISYLFPPLNKASGITVFKRIAENNKKVDVLQGKFDLSSDFNDHVDNYINERFYVSVDDSLDWTSFIFKFIEKGLNEIKKDYENIYSRSWLMANHFLAFEYKCLNRNVFWTAEFSDPLIYDIHNKKRQFKQMVIDDEKFISKINKEITVFNKNNNSNFKLIENNSMAYFIAEYLVYLFADRIIFTNENQCRFMLNQFPENIRQLVLNKSEIRRHPTLSEDFYKIKNVDLNLDNNKVNIAYFGNEFYSKRHFEALFYAVEALNHKFKDKLKIYIYTSDHDLLKKLIPSDIFSVREPLDYLDFLNATTKFDILIVNDAITKDNFEINPYLPSKLSDYLGSNTDIWALYEDGSSLSQFNLKYKSEINDYDSCLYELVKIIEDRGFCDDDFSIDENYINSRLTNLNDLYEQTFRQKQRLESEIEKLTFENNEIKSSNSWKITKPLRNLKNKK